MSSESVRVKRSAPCGVSVIVSGAGIGGLMTALECWRNGCEVKVFEKANMSSPQGDSFTIGPSALEIFKHWPQMKRKNEKIQYNPLFAVHNIQGERVKGPLEFSALVQGPSKAKGMTRHMRPEFHQMLVEQLCEIGVNVEFGKDTVDYFETDDKAGVVLKDGSRYEADLVVAADGIRTSSWPLVLGRQVPAKSSGHAVFRAAYEAEIAEKDPLVAERFKPDSSGRSILETFSGPGVSGIFWKNQNWMTFGIDHPDDRGISAESWNHRVHPDDVLKLTATIPGWSEAANRMIQLTPTSIVNWTIMWRDPQPKWTSPKGRVVQLGDAAHTFLPQSGNGGTQAIEDAISLAACVAIAGKENLPYATRVHNLLRFERVSFIQAMGVANRELRNTNKSKDANKPFVIGPWLVDHDPEQYAYDNYTQALDNIVSGTPFANTNTPPGIPYRPWTIDGLEKALETGEPSILDGGWI